MSAISNWPIQDPPRPSNPQNRGGVEKCPFEIAAKRLEINENVNRPRLIRHFLALNLYALNNRTAFANAPNE